LCRGIPLDTLINCSIYEKEMYARAKEKYYIEETKKYESLLKVIFGEGKK